MQEKRSDYVTKTCDEFERMSTRPPQFGPKSRCFESTFESFLLFKGWAHHRLALDFRHPAWLSSWRGDDVAEQNPEVVISSLNYEELVSARLLRLCFLFLFLFLLFRRFNHRRDSMSCRVAHLQISAGLIESRESLVKILRRVVAFWLISVKPRFRLVSLPAEISLDWLPFQRGNWS